MHFFFVLKRFGSFTLHLVVTFWGTLFYLFKGGSNEKKKIYFFVSSGRSGSNYVANVLHERVRPDVFVGHETSPSMSGFILLLVNVFGKRSTRTIRRIKTKAILANKKTYYVETNHMYLKSFDDVVASLPNTEVIIINRDLNKVFKSFLGLGYFGGNLYSYLWMSAKAIGNAISNLKSINQQERIVRYLLAVEFYKYQLLESNRETRVFSLEGGRIDEEIEDAFGELYDRNISIESKSDRNQRASSKVFGKNTNQDNDQVFTSYLERHQFNDQGFNQYLRKYHPEIFGSNA